MQRLSIEETRPAVPIFSLHHDTMLAGINRLEAHTAAIERDLRALMGNTGKELRPMIEKLTEELIAFLDDTAGDPDLEPDNDAEEGGDEEPTLGSVPCINQQRWAQGYSNSWFGGDELELDPAESGIGDADGLMEQIGGAL